MIRVAIASFGMGNLDSVARAVEECGGRPLLAARGEQLSDAQAIVLPGVGAFADGMRGLRERGLAEALERRVREVGVPVLGVCLGMQLLAEGSDEGDCSEPGLGWVAGRVERLRGEAGERVPHMGWNEVHPSRESDLLAGIPAGKDFYFVHSYHLRCADPKAVLATTPYCGGFVAAVQDGPICGVQFHPEKSLPHGFRLLRNFLDRARAC